MIAVERSFSVAVKPDEAWRRLAQVERWPEWAPHIKRVTVDPTGPLGPQSRGALYIRRLGRNTFRMSAWEPPVRWEWTGGLPGVRIVYDHRFTAAGDGTTLDWIVSLAGPLACDATGVLAHLRTQCRPCDSALTGLDRHRILSDVSVRLIDQLSEARAVVELIGRVWGTPSENPLVRDELVWAVACSGGYAAGAWSDGALVGASVGWLGVLDGAMVLHSHITGVDGDARARGVGWALKDHQRQWALERSISEIRWTFDPLIRRNAWFNLTKLGATIVDYSPDHYGPIDDGINRGDESDRAIVSWAVGGPAVVPNTNAVEVGRCATPDDIEVLRSADPAAAMVWRKEVRTCFLDAFARGWRVAGFTRDGWYVFTEGDAPA